MPAEGRNLGLVFQSYALWPHKTVFDNVAYGLKLRKIGSDEIGDAGHARCWSSFRSATWASAFRTSSPAGSSSGSRWPARSSTTRR